MYKEQKKKKKKKKKRRRRRKEKRNIHEHDPWTTYIKECSTNITNVKTIAFGNQYTTDQKMGVSVLLRLFIKQ